MSAFAFVFTVQDIISVYNLLFNVVVPASFRLFSKCYIFKAFSSVNVRGIIFFPIILSVELVNVYKHSIGVFISHFVENYSRNSP